MFLAPSGVAGEQSCLCSTAAQREASSHLWGEQRNGAVPLSPSSAPCCSVCQDVALGTHNLFSLSFSLIFFRTLISSLAASLYFPTFLMIFSATWDLPLEGRRHEDGVRETEPVCSAHGERHIQASLVLTKLCQPSTLLGQWLIGSAN